MRLSNGQQIKRGSVNLALLSGARPIDEIHADHRAGSMS
jgi:hypothetical protein